MGGCVSGNSPTEDIEVKKGDMKRNKKNDKAGKSAPNSGRQLVSSTSNNDVQVDLKQK